MLLVFSQLIRYSWYSGMDSSSTQLFSWHDLSCCSFDQRRTCQENGTIPFHDDVFICHGRDIGSSSCATSKHDGDLRNSFTGHLCHVVENSTKMTLSWEHFALSRQVSSSWVDQIEARQLVFGCDLLSPEMFADCDRVVCSSLYWRIVGNDHAESSLDKAYTSDDASWVDLFLSIELISCKRGKLKERGSRIQQFFYSFPDNQLSSFMKLVEDFLIFLGSDLDHTVVTLERIEEYCELTWFINSLFLRASESFLLTGKSRGAGLWKSCEKGTILLVSNLDNISINYQITNNRINIPF